MASEEDARSLGERAGLWLGSRLAAMLIRLLRWSNRVDWEGRDVLERIHREEGPYLLAFWHEQLLMMPYVYPGGRITVMISRHGDGEWIARTVGRFGVHATRGSTTRGGSAALRAMVRRIHDGWDGAFTPDGPRGPRRRVQPGVLQAARLSGAPIVPVAVAASRARRLDSWDRFLVPLPLGRLVFVYEEPLRVGREAGTEALEAAAAVLEDRLNAAAARAEALVGERAR